MSNHHCYRALDLPENPLPPHFRLPRATARNHYTILRANEILNRATLRCFHELGLKPGNAALLYKRAGSLGIIHTDVGLDNGRWRKNVAAINWNLSGADSVMRWYEINMPGVEPDLAVAHQEGLWYRALNGIHFGFVGSRVRKNLPRSKVRLLAASPISSATLVRTDIPHAVENTDPAKARWALSVRFEPDFESWSEAVEAFRPLLVSRRRNP